MTANPMQASRQWATRPADERFTSLQEIHDHCMFHREHSRGVTVASRSIQFQPAEGDLNQGIAVTGPNGHAYNPTHWSFGQLANLAGAPAGYLRDLPAPIAADCLNYGMRFKRDVQDIGVLITQNGDNLLRAATGPNYGRIWNASLTGELVNRFGDGLTGQWRVPGEFGQAVPITKANTTLFASDRDLFVFLADEQNRIDLPNRRAGRMGSFARGFFLWNSEVGSTTLGAAFFLFDYVCCNRIVWGAEQFKEIRIRHTSGAPHRWLEEISPVLEDYSHASAKPVVQAIEDARARRLGDDLDKFLQARFTKSETVAIKATHESEEGRPIETAWDAVTGITAYARTIPYQDQRIALEREAGKLLAA